ncbi:FlgD immunoglobulin-like domain containing protein [Candidatus Latescibacterota bacterium]
MSRHYLLSVFICFVLTVGFAHYGTAQIDNSILSGDYIVTGYVYEDFLETSAEYIAMNFTGDGNGTFEFLYSSAGNTGSYPLAYSVNDDGTFVITLTINDDEDIFQGIVTSDGESFTMWMDAGIFEGVRKSSDMANVSLSGDYIVTRYLAAGDDSRADYISMNYDGNGTGTFEILYSSADTIDSGDSGQFTYTVNDDGTCFITFDHDDYILNFAGIVSADREIVTGISTDFLGGSIIFGMKTSSGMSNASLSGEYILLQYFTWGESSAEYLVLNIDGNGNGTYEIVYSSVDNESGAGLFTYSVNDDGTFSMTVTDEGDDPVIVRKGIVSSDGKSITMTAMANSILGIYTGIATTDITTGVHESVDVPDDFALRQNYPNPFNPITTIRYSLEQTDFVQLDVYTITGSLVQTLVRGETSPGSYTVVWDGRDDNGLVAASGVYFYTLKIGDAFVDSRRMVLQK